MIGNTFGFQARNTYVCLEEVVLGMGRVRGLALPVRVDRKEQTLERKEVLHHEEFFESVLKATRVGGDFSEDASPHKWR